MCQRCAIHKQGVQNKYLGGWYDMELGIAQLTFTSWVKLYTDELAKLVRGWASTGRAASMRAVTSSDWSAIMSVVCADLFGRLGFTNEVCQGKKGDKYSEHFSHCGLRP